MENYISIVALISVVVFGTIWAISPKMAGKTAIKTFAFIVAVLLFAAMLAIPGLVRADELEGKITFITPAINDDGEAVAIVDVDTVDGGYWRYEASGRIEVGGKVKLTIIDGEVRAVEDAEESPSSIPAVIGIIAIVTFIVTVVKITDRRCSK